MDPHRLSELRSRAYHAEIAARLHADPAIRRRALHRVATWRAAGHPHDRLVEAWRGLLALPDDALAARLVADDERMVRLRSVSPFAGELAPRERWLIWRAVRDGVAS